MERFIGGLLFAFGLALVLLGGALFGISGSLGASGGYLAPLGAVGGCVGLLIICVGICVAYGRDEPSPSMQQQMKSPEFLSCSSCGAWNAGWLGRCRVCGDPLE